MRYRFGEFELDGDAYTLLRGGRELALQPKVFEASAWVWKSLSRKSAGPLWVTTKSSAAGAW